MIQEEVIIIMYFAGKLVFSHASFPLTGPHILRLDHTQITGLQHSAGLLKKPVKGGGAHRAHIRMSMNSLSHTHTRTHTHARTEWISSNQQRPA